MNNATSRAQNPFKGLHYYTEEDRDLFFGRRRETDEFVKVVARDILSVLFARSGLGKTSLLRAGVMPRLREQDYLPVIVRIDYAESAPWPAAQIVLALLAAAAEARVEVEAVDGMGVPSQGNDWSGTLWEFFHRHQFWNQRNDLVRPVLILDQFEELFTLGRSSTRSSEFLAQLADLAENRMPRCVRSDLERSGERLAFDTRAQNFKLILALREDYVARLDSLRPEMPSVMRNRYPLAPLERERALGVVQEAGQQWIGEDVARAIVAAVAGEDGSPEPGTPSAVAAGEIEPAYLSVMCDELFRRMVAQGKARIDLDLVRVERGRILDALYERSFTGLAPATRVFVEERLLTAGGFRGSVPVAESQREGVALSDLESLVNNSRLLRFEDRLGTIHVELSHDLLTPIVRKSRDARQAEAMAQTEREAEQAREAAFKTRLRQERRRLWAAGASVVLLAGGIAFYLWGWVLPYHTYCRDFSKRWGVVHPVGPLAVAAVAHRQWTIRLTQDGRFNPVHTVEVIDANHQPTAKAPITTYLTGSDQAIDPGRNPSSIEFVYDRDKRVVHEVAYDRFRRMAWGFVYAPGGKSDHGRSRSVKGMFLGSDGFPQPQSHSRAEFVEIAYNPAGFESELRYKDREGNPMPGRDNAHGESREYDKQGRVVRRTSLDQHGQPTNDAAGNAGLKLDYDPEGNLSEQRAIDAKGEPTLLRSGYHRSTFKFDQWGRLTERRFFNLSYEPVEERDESGAHRITWEYDQRGNPTNLKLFDRSEKPVAAGKKLFDFAAHEQRATFDAQNRLQTVAYFDGQGKPLAGPAGWHMLRIEYDDQGFPSAVSYFDGSEKPANSMPAGAHRIALANDAFGQPIEVRFYGSDGQPMASVDHGYHLRKNEYDKVGNVIAESHFAVGGNKVRVLSSGAQRYEMSFDRFRNLTLTRYLDEDHRPINNHAGFHKIVSTYDDYGSETERRWYDKDEQPAVGPDGVQVIRSSYDKRGLLRRRANYDAQDRAVTDRQGIHETLTEFNDKRQPTRWQVFGLNGKPAEDKVGNHLVLAEFDERGRETAMTQKRADGRANWDRELGIATIRQVYDKDGKWTEQAFYNAEDRLVRGPYGYARRRSEKEPDGRMAWVDYGSDGQPVFNPLQGCAIRKSDGRNRGDTIESCHGANGALIEGPEGYAERRRRWSDDGKLLAEAFFGPDGGPVAGPQGYHRSAQMPGSDVRYFDAEGRELQAAGSADGETVIFVAEIRNVKDPAARAGIQAGDVLWRYGNWSYPQSLAAERSKGTPPDRLARAVVEAFFAERDRLSGRAASMTVIRHGLPVQLTVPPLPDKLLGAQLNYRWIPVATLAAWSGIGAGKASGIDRNRQAVASPLSSR